MNVSIFSAEMAGSSASEVNTGQFAHGVAAEHCCLHSPVKDTRRTKKPVGGARKSGHDRQRWAALNLKQQMLKFFVSKVANWMHLLFGVLCLTEYRSIFLGIYVLHVCCIVHARRVSLKATENSEDFILLWAYRDKQQGRTSRAEWATVHRPQRTRGPED